MTPKEILEIDVQQNQPDYMTVPKAIGFINKMLSQGSKMVRQGDTLILFKNIGNSTAEFHSFSADKPTEYLKNMKKFSEMLKKMGFEFATTEYENPKLYKVFKICGFDATIEKTDNGYKALVRL